MPCRAFGDISLKESDNAFRLTVQDLAKPLQRIHSDGLIMLELVNGLGIDAVLMDQRIGRHALLRHGLPQRFIADHVIAPFQSFNFIIFGRLSLYYTQKSNYNVSCKKGDVHMVDYKKLYFQLFNTLTDALEAPNLDAVRHILRQAQADAEETYLRDTDDEESSP